MSEDARDFEDEFDDEDYGEEAQAEASQGSSQLLIKAPREMPQALGKKVVGWFAGWTVATLVVGGIFLGFGISERTDYRGLLETKYFGEVATADVSNAFSEEGEHWATVTYQYKGKSIRTDVDIDESEIPDIQATRKVDVVFWPEEPKDAVTVPWIDSKSPMGEYGYLFIIGLILSLIGMIVATVGYRRRKARYTEGVETWGSPISHIVYNDEASTYSTTVSYVAEGATHEATVSWNTSKDPVLDGQDRMVGLVVPGKPKKFYVLGHDEVEALQA